MKEEYEDGLENEEFGSIQTTFYLMFDARHALAVLTEGGGVLCNHGP